MIYLLVLLLTSQSVLAQTCVTKTPAVTVFPSEKETYLWGLQDVFFSGLGLSYDISDKASLDIVQPVSVNAGAVQSSNFLEINSFFSLNLAAKPITTVRAKALESNGVWINSFVALGQDTTGIAVYWAQGQFDDFTKAPTFQSFIISNTPGDACHDVSFTNVDGAYVADCQRTVDGKLTAFFVWTDGTTKLEIPNSNLAGYQTVTKRFLGHYTQPSSIGRSQSFLFRATPSYAVTSLGNLSGDSLIEVFRFESNGAPKETYRVFDAARLAFLLFNEGYTVETFDLVDFQVQPNGDIWVLDAKHGIYILRFLPNGDWELVSQIAVNLGQAFAFDKISRIQNTGVLVESIAVLAQNIVVLFQDRKPVQIFDLPYTSLTYPASVSLSQQFIVVENSQNLYLFDSDLEGGNKVLYTYPYTGFALVNPFQPDIVLLSTTSSSRLTLSRGYLKLSNTAQKTAALGTVTITAKPQTGTATCTATVTFQVLPEGDKTIIQIPGANNQLPKAVTEQTEPFQLNQLASGPNLNYAQVTPKALGASLTVAITSKQDLSVTNVQLPDPKKVHYTSVLSNPTSSNLFNILFQTDDNEVQIFSCNHPSIYNATTTCSLLSKAKYPVLLNDKIFNWWYSGNTITLSALASDAALVFYTIAQTAWTESYRISYATGGITTYTYLQDYTYVIYKDQVDVYFTYTGKIVNTLTKASFADQSATISWKPTSLYGNRVLKSNIVFIVNDNNVIVGDFHQQLTLLKVIPYTAGNEIALAIGFNSFFVVERNQVAADAGSITEYNFASLNNIYLQKQVNLYIYQLTTPIVADFCSETGFLFITALCTECNKVKVLAYRPNALAHDTLYQSWLITAQDGLLAKQFISSSGGEQMFIYSNDGTTHNIYSLVNTPGLSIQAQANDPTFSTNLNLEISISNTFKDVTPLTLTQKVKVINTQTKIAVDATKFNKNNALIAVQATKQEDVVYPLGTDWYSGQVIGVEITGKDYVDQIKVQQRVNKNQTTVFGDYVVYDAQDWPEYKVTLVQATDAILILRNDNTLYTPVIQLDIPQSWTCDQIQGDQNLLYIASLCYDENDQYYAVITSCASHSECFPTDIRIPVGPNVAKFKLLYDHIILLRTDVNDPANYDGQLEVHIVQIGETWTVKLLNTIDLELIQTAVPATEAFHPADFELAFQRSVDGFPYFKVIVTDTDFGLYFHDFFVKDGVYQSYSLDLFGLDDFLNTDADNIYINPETTLYQAFGLLGAPSFENVAKVFKAQILLTTSDVANYGLQLTFKEDQDKKGTLLDKVEVTQILNRYGGWKTLNKVSVNTDFVAIPFQSTDKTQVLISVYNITQETPVKGQVVAAGPDPQTIIGGALLQYTEPADVKQLGLYIPPYGDFVSLYATQGDQTISVYNLYAQPSLNFGTGKDIAKDGKKVEFSITLAAVNTLSNEKVPDVKVNVNPYKAPSTEESSKLWWIILIIVGSLLLIGVVGFIFYKNKKSKTDALLG